MIIHHDFNSSLREHPVFSALVSIFTRLENLIFRRERSDDRIYVCGSQPILIHDHPSFICIRMSRTQRRMVIMKMTQNTPTNI